MPKISVIIPVYNTEKYISKCLDSVINQTLNDIEIICVNDGSTDNSYKILLDYAKKYSNILVINQKNKKQGAARNTALKVSKGKYIVFLDSDDYLDVKTLEILYSQAIKSNLDMLSFAGTNFYDNTKKLLYNKYYQFSYLPKNFNIKCFSYKDCSSFITNMAVSACLTCYKRDFIKKNDIYFPENLYFEDNVFFVKSLLTAKRCGICMTTLYYRRIHSKSTTQNWNKYFGDYLLICEQVISLVDELPISEDIRLKYRNAYIQNSINIFEHFNSQYKRKYQNNLNLFIKKFNNINKHQTILKYKLFNFIPLLSIENT